MLYLSPREFIRLFDDRYRTSEGRRVNFAIVAHLPLSIGAYLRSTSTDIRLGVDYAKKFIEHHKLHYEEILVIPYLIEHAAIICEKKFHLSFLGQEEHGHRMYNLVLKGSKDEKEIWIATLHRVRIDDLNRKIKKARRSGSIIRDFSREFDE